MVADDALTPRYDVATARLRLRALALDEVRLLVRGERAALGERLGAVVPAAWPGERLASGLPGIAEHMAALGGDERWVWVVVAPGSAAMASPTSVSAARASAVASPAPAAVIGDIGFHGPVTGSPSIEIGYILLPGARGRGYATEGVAALVAWALARPGVARVTARIAPGNAASLRVAKKVGMRPTACESPELLCFERLRSESEAPH